MLNVHTPYEKLFRRTYDADYDFTGVSTGQWVKIEGDVVQKVADGDSLTNSNLKLILSRVSSDGSIYEGHDTASAGTVTVIEGFGAVYTVDGEGAANDIAENDLVEVGSSAAGGNLGKLIKVTGAGNHQVVGRCISGVSGDANKQIQILSPYVKTI